MKELEQESGQVPVHLQKKTASDDDAVLVEAGGPATGQGKKTGKGQK